MMVGFKTGRWGDPLRRNNNLRLKSLANLKLSPLRKSGKISPSSIIVFSPSNLFLGYP